MTRLLLTLVFLSVLSPLEAGEPTRIAVSVLANGAKFIGDKTGGAEIEISDAESGDVLARGITRGGTGNTSRLMGDDGGIYQPLAGEGDAVFVARLDLDVPRRVVVRARGPLDFPEAVATASESLWLIPGDDVDGDQRVLLTLNGYIVEPVSMDINAMGSGSVRVSLQMLCGCPIQPGGTWDADRIEKRAVLVGADGREQTSPLEYAGTGTEFEARFGGQVKHPQAVRIELAGMDDSNVAVQVLPLR